MYVVDSSFPLPFYPSLRSAFSPFASSYIEGIHGLPGHANSAPLQSSELVRSIRHFCFAFAIPSSVLVYSPSNFISLSIFISLPHSSCFHPFPSLLRLLSTNCLHFFEGQRTRRTNVRERKKGRTSSVAKRMTDDHRRKTMKALEGQPHHTPTPTPIHNSPHSAVRTALAAPVGGRRRRTTAADRRRLFCPFLLRRHFLLPFATSISRCTSPLPGHPF
jgi:hypothetical protein